MVYDNDSLLLRQKYKLRQKQVTSDVISLYFEMFHLGNPHLFIGVINHIK